MWRVATSLRCAFGGRCVQTGKHVTLTLLVSRCQIIFGSLAVPSSRQLCDDFASLRDVVPDTASVPERLMIRGLISRVIARMLSTIDVYGRLDLTPAFLAWTACDASAPTWHTEVCDLIDRCARTLGATAAKPDECAATDSRVRRAVAFLDTRFRKSSLNLSMCAAEMHLSVWHASRLLKRHTGIGFAEHLHARRLRAAELLLMDDGLSVKEIAAAVGYGSATQLGRHFRLQKKLTPIAYRRSLRRRQSAA
jgi:AraC-like DNA-binding protein